MLPTNLAGKKFPVFPDLQYTIDDLLMFPFFGMHISKSDKASEDPKLYTSSFDFSVAKTMDG